MMKLLLFGWFRADDFKYFILFYFILFLVMMMGVSSGRGNSAD